MDKFELKTSLDNKLYAVYNVLSELLFRLDVISRSLVCKNIKFKGLHEGESCYILGTGPSLSNLSMLELEYLKNHKTIAVNSYFKSRISKSLVPDYYCLMDNLYWEEWSDTFGDIIQAYGPEMTTRFITDYRAKPLLSFLRGSLEPIYIYSKKYPYKEVCCDLSKNIYGVMNVVSFSIIAAIYLGFGKIYLLGCDYNAFCNMGSGHCYNDDDEVSQTSYDLAFYLKFYWITTEFHYLISKLARENGVTIVNLTAASLLDAYPRMSFSEHIEINNRQ